MSTSLEHHTSLEDLRRQAVSILQDWGAGEQTRKLAALADVLVSARSMFRTEDGVDWGGRSWEYRQFIGGIYDEAGMDSATRHPIQAAVRYHVGNLLRATVEPDELERVGLLGTSPKDRLSTQRNLGSILLNRESEQPLWRLHPDAPRTWHLSVKAFTAALEQLEKLDPSRLTDQQRTALLGQLRSVCDRATAVMDTIQGMRLTN